MNDARVELAPNQLESAKERAESVLREVANRFVGPSDVAELLLVALLARGHVLLEGVPGIAKTTLARTFAATLGCSFKRVQFTPDLMPSDITGVNVLSPREGSFALRPGPVFAQVVLCDEINRAPAKTQSALLEAMQELQVTIDGDSHRLPEPFLVLATQNPIEHAGTYPLPEAQIDRFLIRVLLGYPTAEQEQLMLTRFGHALPTVAAVLSPDDVVELQLLSAAMYADSALIDYVVRLAGSTRTHPQIALGASPRASLGLLHAAKAVALLRGRNFVLPDDVQQLAVPVLAHRLLLTPEAQLEGQTAVLVVEQLLRALPYRRGL